MSARSNAFLIVVRLLGNPLQFMPETLSQAHLLFLKFYFNHLFAETQLGSPWTEGPSDPFHFYAPQIMYF